MSSSLPPEMIDRVFRTDILELLGKLPDGSIDMVYGDPDYNMGVSYGGVSYRMDFDDYIDWYSKVAAESVRVLKETGNAFFINFPKQNAYLRVKCLDELCYDVRDYSWVYNTNVGHTPRHFTTAHRSILHCIKTKYNRFFKEAVAQPYKNPSDRRIRENLKNGSKGRMPYDWFYFDLVKNVSQEKTAHACQIPQKLSAMLISACTLAGDTVLILFGGSGSEIVCCRDMGRKYISAEIDERYYRIITERLGRSTKG
ncbi:MAG: site-specific DNA-methyltransferase [Methanomassiliicoccales archaeon]|nr:site-specific DNA-methyltransferase [Methanomassiliicoccales archaeon]